MSITADEASTPARAARRYRIAVVIVVTLLALPILLTTYAPLVDYPNHLARTSIIARYDDVPEFRETFALFAEPIHNLAIDLVIVPLAGIMSPVAAGKVFLLLALALHCLGCHLLGRVLHRGPTTLSLVAMASFHNSMFFYGFVNYAFGVALFLVTTALWLEYRRRWTLGRYVAVAALVIAAYLSHLTAFAFIGVTWGLVVLVDLFKRRTTLPRGLRDLAHLALGLVLFVAFMGGGGSVGTIEWNTLVGKGVAMLAPFLGYSYIADGLYVAALATLALVLLRRGTLRHIDTGIAVSAAAMFVALLVTPQLLFTSAGADARWVLPAFCLGAVASRWQIDQELKWRLVGMFVVAVALHIATITVAWTRLDAQTAESVALFDKIPERSRLYSIFYRPTSRQEDKNVRPLQFVPCYATITREAIMSTIFAYRSQQPITYRVTPLEFRPDYDFMRIDRDSVLRDVDYVVTFGSPDSVDAWLAPRTAFVDSAAGFTLRRVSTR